MRYRNPLSGGRKRGPRYLLQRSVRLISTGLAFAALWNFSGAPPLHAHGMPASLDDWGAYTRRIAHCQQLIGREAAACAMQAWTVRRTCLLGTLHDVPCDKQAANDAIETARINAINAVGAGCTNDQDVVTLRFLDRSEAENDVVTFCRDLENAGVSAVFLPVPDDPDTMTEEARSCVEATAWATTKLFHLSFESRQLLLDRIAQFPYSPTDKRAMLSNATAAIAQTSEVLQNLMGSTCSPDAFMRTYGRDQTTFFTLIATRADCLSGRAYAQAGVLCPASQCGNGMQEAGEDCDDGNLVDGDGCSSMCTRD